MLEQLSIAKQDLRGVSPDGRLLKRRRVYHTTALYPTPVTPSAKRLPAEQPVCGLPCEVTLHPFLAHCIVEVSRLEAGCFMDFRGLPPKANAQRLFSGVDFCKGSSSTKKPFAISGVVGSNPPTGPRVWVACSRSHRNS